MKISVVTPSYNQGRYVRQCIESVLAQNREECHVEHIIIDACSTDETISILKEYTHLNWSSEPDAGQSDGINKGFLRATGDYVMWLNADDYLLPDSLTKVTRHANLHGDADVIYGGWRFVDAAGNVTKTVKLFPFDLHMIVHYGPYIGSTACFFKRSTTVAEGHLLNTSFRHCMDMEYHARLGKLGKKFVYLPEVLADFRMHGENESIRHLNEKSTTGILKRQIQIAEGAAVRRAYGITLFNEPFADGVVDAALWYYFRIKKVILKIVSGAYS